MVNRYAFRDLSHVVLRWVVTDDADTVARGEIADLAVAPRDSADLMLGGWMACCDARGERLLTVSYVLKRDEPFRPAGTVVAWDQFAIPELEAPVVAVAAGPDVALAQDSARITVTGPRFLTGPTPK